MTVQYSPKALAKVLTTRKKFTIVSHYNPDPDAYGSSCGLAHALKALGKEVEVINQNGIEERLSWIPGVQQVQTKPSASIDTLIICDCGAFDRIGDELKIELGSANLTIDIDHHSQNALFGDANLVRESASSTSELIFEIIEELPKAAWTKDAATALLAGIYGDTGSFRHTNVTPKVFEIAAKLSHLGADIRLISQSLFSSYSMPSVLLQAEALSQLKSFSDGKIAIIEVSEELLKKYNASSDDADGLAEKARNISGVLISVSARKDDDIWRVSLRSKDPRYDVSEVARSFGGGGHKVAAAFRSRQKEWSTVESQLIEKLQNLV